jgi:hypothetical protein
MSANLRRWLALVCVLGASSQVGCEKERSVETAFRLETNQELDPQRETISVLLPPESDLLPLVDQLERELESTFNVQFVVVGSSLTVEGLDKHLEQQRPRLVVLLNNPTVRLYGTWARQQSAPPASLILMSSFAGELVRTVPNSTAISWEVPIVTSVQGLRGLGIPVSRLGVVFRKGFSSQIEREREMANPERVRFVSEVLTDDPGPRELKAAIVRLRNARVDALWVPNDNGLLSAQFLSSVWVPYLRHFGRPVVVGVPSLVRGDMRLGSYAAVPDLEALGIQAADRIFAIADENFRVPRADEADVPLSVRTYVSVRAVEDFDVGEGRLSQVDFVVERGGLDP